MIARLLGNPRGRLLALICVVLLPALGLIFYTTSGEWVQEKAHARVEALRSVKVAAGRHEQLMEATRHLLVALGHLPQVQNGDTPACNALFAGIQKEFPLYSALGAADAGGRFFCSSSPGQEPANIGGEPFFRQAVEKRRLSMSPYLAGGPAGGASVIVAQPVTGPGGDVRAVVTASLDLGRLNQLAARTVLPPGGDFTVIDSAGTILARYPDPEKWVGTAPPEIPLIRTILEHKEGTAEARGLDGIQRLNAFMPLGEASGDMAYASVGIPLPQAYEEATEAVPRGMIGAIALLIIFAAWFAGDVLLLRRVRLLSDAAKSMASGDLSVRTGVTSPREDVGDLMRSFDDMAQALHRQQEELRGSEAKYRLLSQSAVGAMAHAVESRDPYTAGHQKRVSDIACALAREMGLPAEEIEGILMAGLIHDVGKIAVPAEILSKPGRIGEHEIGLIKCHSQTGFDILKSVEFPWPVAQIVYQHHERMDGSGYPQNLKGDEILFEARIIAVADVLEAMASHRPYRAALGIDAALEEIMAGRGTRYDASVVDACMRLAGKGELDSLLMPVGVRGGKS
ncbi:MAG: HD domain-containing phosphohydrolase [Syntrophobacteraceae bacterium]